MTVQQLLQFNKTQISNTMKKIRLKFFLKNRSFSIISNNCWGGIVYQHYGLEYRTPTVGCYFYAEDYLRFLKNLNYYLSLELKFIPYSQSKYIDSLKEKKQCPIIGVLDDVEIIFLHYATEAEAKEKWNRRKKRVNPKNLVVKFNDQNLCTDELIREFDGLPYLNKICFVHKKFDDCKYSIYLSEFKNCPYVISDIRVYRKYINITKYLNCLKQS